MYYKCDQIVTLNLDCYDTCSCKTLTPRRSERRCSLYTNYIYVDGWCEEGEVQEETHQRADPRIELYIEIPRNTGAL